MKFIKSIYQETKSSLYTDKVNLYMLIFQIVAFSVTYIIWNLVIEKRDIFIYTKTSYYPLQIFAFIFVIHLFLSVYSYKNDKHISHILLGASSFLMLIIITIEFLYILNR